MSLLPGKRQAQRTDGVRTIADLQARCVVDEITECWMWRHGRNGNNRPRLWVPELQRLTTLGVAICVLRTGAAPRPGEVWYCTCETRDCANPLHRKRGTRASLQRHLARRPRHPLWRARIAAGRRAQSKLSDAAADEIRMSSELLCVLARRHGISASYASRIRLGRVRRPLNGWGASVFNPGK